MVQIDNKKIVNILPIDGYKYTTTECTNDVEVAVKTYKAGDMESAHYHKIATEITVVNEGNIRMFNKVWKRGDIIVAEPNDVTSFEALTEAVLTVVKLPGANNDKYPAEE